ncbi:MAG: glycoside hydrolase family 26 protein [Streptosporangiaceae bacterium]
MFVVLAIAVFAGVKVGMRAEHDSNSVSRQTTAVIRPARVSPPADPAPFVGVYMAGLPDSVAPLEAFASRTGARLRLAMYYSSWNEPFQTAFASAAGRLRIMPLVRMQPAGVSLAEIADGSQDDYLVSYADAVRQYGHPVVLSFGPEMNGDWYSWGYRNASPSDFIAAWRHIVDVFRTQRADNVTWLWTVESVAAGDAAVESPDAWWPGRKYVAWVGMDGYYSAPGETFSTLFGPTVTDLRALTGDPILVAATGATSQAGKVAKIADLFAGVRADHLLGLVWSDANGSQDWRIDTPATFTAFGRAADQGQ